MQIIKRTVSRKTNGSTFKAVLTVQPEKGHLRLSSGAMTRLAAEGKYLGLGLDGDKTFIYLSDVKEDGHKIGKSGQVNARSYTETLAGTFKTASLTKDFKLDIDLDNPTDHEGITLYELTTTSVEEIESVEDGGYNNTDEVSQDSSIEVN